MDAAPFRALRYDPRVVGRLLAATAPAYDELSPHTYARHRTANPYTVLQLLAPEAPPGSPAAASYRSAAEAYRRLRRMGVLVEDPTPSFFLYELHELRSGRPVRMRGLLAAVAAGDAAASGIAVHEAVDPRRVARRAARLQAVPVDLAPVLVVAPQLPAGLRALLDRSPDTAPVAAVTDEDGVDHRVWPRGDPEEVRALRRGLAEAVAVIADGHHRWAAAQLQAGRPPGPAARACGGDGHAPWRTLALVVDAAHDGPQVQAVHRLLPALPADWAQRLGAHFTLTPQPPDVHALQAAMIPAGLVLGLLLPLAAVLLRARDPAALRARLPAGASSAWRALDAALVEHVVLPLLGVEPASAQARADPLVAAQEVLATGASPTIPGPAARGGPDGPALLLMRAPSPAAVAAIALGGERMPAKSTSFRPKPRTGLLMRAVQAPEA